MNQGPICAKVYPEGIQPIKGNNCGLIPLNGAIVLNCTYFLSIFMLLCVLKFKVKESVSIHCSSCIIW